MCVTLGSSPLLFELRVFDRPTSERLMLASP
jgi:hypothetical protein